MDRIVVLDYGSQTTHLIARRIRETGVFAEIIPGETPLSEWISDDTRGVILSGSPYSVHDRDIPVPDRSVYSSGLPILGICYGAQITAHLNDGSVSRSKTREYGPAPVVRTESHPLFDDISEPFESWMSHGDAIVSLPKGAVLLAHTERGVTAAYEIPEYNFIGFQFHPEVTHTRRGIEILTNFVHRICKARPEWTMEHYFEEVRRRVRERTGSRDVLLLISGGVDSTVVATILLETLDPRQVHLMYIDTGLMRKGESREVSALLKTLGARHLHLIDAEADFLEALEGVVDPEKKREIIGDLFIRIQEREIHRLIGPDYLLAQGTLYTDLIESGHGVGRHANRIKSHHNVAAPEIVKRRDEGFVVEPLSGLYKDEVRALGTLLGLPHNVVNRHPFPGPGLGVRILGEITKERCNVLRDADAIFIEELKNAALYDQIWQAFAVLLPVRSVGVAGDVRAYGSVVALRAITSVDGMTADIFSFPEGFLRRVASRITNEIPAVGRVVYDLSGKPPATIEWE